MNKLLIELIASTFFLYVILATKNNAIAVGSALATTIMLGGGDVNPATTIMNVMGGKLTMNDAVPAILVQIAGGLVALELHKRVQL
jgi:glycerol uptake facilitator-like aquaporin